MIEILETCLVILANCTKNQHRRRNDHQGTISSMTRENLYLYLNQVPLIPDFLLLALDKTTGSFAFNVICFLGHNIFIGSKEVSASARNSRAGKEPPHSLTRRQINA